MKQNIPQTIAVFDFDKTITRKHTFWRFLRFSMGLFHFYAYLIYLLPTLIAIKRNRGNIFYLRERVINYIFKGMSKEKFEKLNIQFAQRYLNSVINPEALRKIEAHKSNGDYLVLLSNSNELYLKEWARQHDFDLVLGSLFEVVDGRLTGQLDGGHCFGKNKVLRLEAALGDLAKYEIYGYGDSRGDKELLSISKHPFLNTFENPVQPLVKPYDWDHVDDTNEILIVGAGAVGLSLACELARFGVKFRIIEKLPHRHQQSRAFAIHSRTLEIFDYLGVGKDLIRLGRKIDKGNIIFKDRPLLNTDFSVLEARYPFLISLEQYRLEEVLSQKLASYGINVEYGVELDKVIQHDGGVIAKLQYSDGTKTSISPSWIIGADGARSTVRKTADIPFNGHRYDSSFIVIDGNIDYKHPIKHADTYLNEKGYMMIAPFPGETYCRMVLEVPSNDDHADLDTNIKHVRELISKYGFEDLTINEVRWMSKSRVQRRLVSSLQSGRVLLVGDAAHIQSPVGGQGLNTGIQDAFNLAWKLAFVVKGIAKESLIFSYNDERLPKAKDVLDRTDRLHKMLTLRSRPKQMLRNLLLRSLGKLTAFKKKLIYTVAGLHQRHTDSVLSAGLFRSFTGNLRPGDRFPDTKLSSGSDQSTILNLLRHEGFSLLIFTKNLSADKLVINDFVDLLNRSFPNLVRPILLLDKPIEDKLDQLSNWVVSSEAFIEQNFPYPKGMYLIRPDGYIADIIEGLDFDEILSYLNRFFIKQDMSKIKTLANAQGESVLYQMSKAKAK